MCIEKLFKDWNGLLSKQNKTTKEQQQKQQQKRVTGESERQDYKRQK